MGQNTRKPCKEAQNGIVYAKKRGIQFLKQKREVTQKTLDK